jgi:hypothetical protein
MGNKKQVRSDDLEAILLWEGEISNQRIRETLGVQPVWASRLLAELALRMRGQAARSTSHAPLRLNEDTGEPTVNYVNSSADDYLRVMMSSEFPQHWITDARNDLSMVPTKLFAVVSKAARTSSGLRVSYRSMNNPEGAHRVIYPHAIVRTGMRWHVRAWCSLRLEFRDFTLGRMSDVSLVDEKAPYGQSEDAGWQTMVAIKIAAHPDLSQARKQMIQDEYFLGFRTKNIDVRHCMVGYTLQDLMIAADVKLQQPPAYLLALDEPDRVPPVFGGNG